MQMRLPCLTVKRDRASVISYANRHTTQLISAEDDGGGGGGRGGGGGGGGGKPDAKETR